MFTVRRTVSALVFIAIAVLLGDISGSWGVRPARAAALSPGCAVLDGNTGGNAALITVGFGPEDFWAGDTLTITITLIGATQVTLEIPGGNVVDTVTSNGTLSYTFPANVTSFGQLTGSGGLGYNYSMSCVSGSGGGKGAKETPPFLPAVQPLDDPEEEAYFLGQPTEAGVLPCGVFDLKGEGQSGWGYKTAYLEGWPECIPYTPDLVILCWEQIEFWYYDNGPKLFSEWVWTDKNVHDLEVRDDGMEFTWNSTQDGVCGFFPK